MTTLSSLSLDPETWARARAWALWKALIIAAGLISPPNIFEKGHPFHVINNILKDD